MSDGATWNVPQWTLGWRLQRALAFGDVKVDDMAAYLARDRRTLSRWMHDKGVVPIGYVRLWALRCGVPFEWLAYGADAGPTTPDDPDTQAGTMSSWITTARGDLGDVIPMRHLVARAA